MDEIINRLKDQVGLTEIQAVQAITVIKDFTKEKFPLFADAIDKLFDKYTPSDDEDFMG